MVSSLRIICRLGEKVLSLISPIRPTVPSGRVASSAPLMADFAPTQTIAASQPSPVSSRMRSTAFSFVQSTAYCAPFSSAEASRSGFPSTAMTFAPSALAMMTPPIPIGPTPKIATLVSFVTPRRLQAV